MPPGGTIIYEENRDSSGIPFENAVDIKIVSHTTDSDTATVDICVEWRTAPNGDRCTGKYLEIDIQSTIPDELYAYWRELGGRQETTKLSEYHVYKVIEESPTKYLVQWTGYDDDEATWEPKRKVQRICPRAVLDWTQ
ncbi:hypothetical protein ACHAPU_011437 [Fusarium lateritium]